MEGLLGFGNGFVPPPPLLPTDPSMMAPPLFEWKVFVGALDKRTTRDVLKRYFEKFGIVKDVWARIDPATNHCAGFGFVTFLDPQSVGKVLATRDHYIYNKWMDCKFAMPKDLHSQLCAAFGVHTLSKELKVCWTSPEEEGSPKNFPMGEILSYFNKFGTILGVDTTTKREGENKKVVTTAIKFASTEGPAMAMMMGKEHEVKHGILVECETEASFLNIHPGELLGSVRKWAYQKELVQIYSNYFASSARNVNVGLTTIQSQQVTLPMGYSYCQSQVLTSSLLAPPPPPPPPPMVLLENTRMFMKKPNRGNWNANMNTGHVTRNRYHPYSSTSSPSKEGNGNDGNGNGPINPLVTCTDTEQEADNEYLEEIKAKNDDECNMFMVDPILLTPPKEEKQNNEESSLALVVPPQDIIMIPAYGEQAIPDFSSFPGTLQNLLELGPKSGFNETLLDNEEDQDDVFLN